MGYERAEQASTDQVKAVYAAELQLQIDVVTSEGLEEIDSNFEILKRTMSAAYHSKIYDWFSNQQVKTSESEHASTHRGTSSVKNENAFESSSNSLNMYMPLPINKTVLSKEQNCDTSKKRNTKNEIKRIDENIDTFILSKINLSDRSSKVYRHVLVDFNKFSL